MLLYIVVDDDLDPDGIQKVIDHSPVGEKGFTVRVYVGELSRESEKNLR